MWKERIQYQTYLYRDTSADLKKKAFEYPLVYGKNKRSPLLSGSSSGCWLSSRHSSIKLVPRVSLPSAKPAGSLKEQCPDYAHARVSPVFSSKDNRTAMLTRQDFLPDRTADRDLLFIFSSNILDFQRRLSSYIKIWLAVRRLIAILSLAGPPRDPKISFRSL